MQSGIYCIIHLESGKRYFGSATNFQRRWALHRSALENRKHGNPILQNTWSKYGKQAFDFQILERCSIDKLIEREQWYLANECVFWFDFNIRAKAENNLGMKHSPEARQKMANARTGRAPMLGKTHSDETREKMRLIHTGLTQSPESIAKRVLTRTGKKNTKKFSDETREKMRLARLGKKFPRTTICK